MKERLYTLDAMRGLAAILVVLYHLGDVGFRSAPGGYLAVDFFFALSGLVLAQAYEEPLRQGMGVGDFMRRRFIRLYPMFILGVGFAVVKAVGQIATGDENAMPPLQVAGALVTEIFMLPSPVTGVDLFPLNGPAWSLFFELVINLAFAAAFVSMRSLWLRVVVLIAAVAVCAAAWQVQTLNVGWSWATSWGGLARVTFSFCVGALIFRRGVFQNAGSWLMVVPVLALILVMSWPGSGSWRPIFDCAVALIVSPALVMLGARLQPPAFLNGVCQALGDLSFPIYAIHFPLLFMAGFAARKIGLSPVVWVPAFVLALAVFAWMLGRWIDPVLRRWMTSVLTRPKSA